MRAITSLAFAAGASGIGLPPGTTKAAPPAATHAVRGVVKSVSRFYIVIVTGSGKKAHEMTFQLAPSTEREGSLTIGATVSIRYRVEAHTLVMTALSAEPEKGSPAPPPRR